MRDAQPPPRDDDDDDDEVLSDVARQHNEEMYKKAFSSDKVRSRLKTFSIQYG